MDIGQRIKERREFLGLTQEELAFKLGYANRSSVNKVENSREVSMKKIEKYAIALDTTVAYLMGWEDSEIKVKAEADAKISNLWMIDPDSELVKFIEIQIDKEIGNKFNKQYEIMIKYIEKLITLTEKQQNIIFGMIDEMSKKEGED